MATQSGAPAGLSFSPTRNQWLLTAFFVVVLPLVLLLLWKTLPMTEYARELIDWVEDKGIVGVAGFWLIYVIAAVLGIPRTPMHVLAGVVFSFPIAMLVVLVGAASAHSTTFWIARTVAHDWVCRKLESAPQAARVLDLVDEECFKLVLLVRMNLFIPGVLKGYGFGTTEVPYWKYLAASVLGFLPIGLAHVYLGWAGGMAVLDGNGEFSDVQKWMIAGGVVVSVILVAGVYYYGRRLLKKRYPTRSSEDGADENGRQLQPSPAPS